MAIHVQPTIFELQDLDFTTKLDTDRSSENTMLSNIEYMETRINNFNELCKDQNDIQIVMYVNAFIKCMSIVCNNLLIVRKRNNKDFIVRYYNLRETLDNILKKFNSVLRIKYYINAPLSLTDNLLYVTTFDFMEELQDRHDKTQKDISDDMYEGIKRIQKVINKHKKQLDEDEHEYDNFSRTDKQLHDEDRIQISETQKVIDHMIDHFLGESNQSKYYKDFPNIPIRESPIQDQHLEPVAGGRFTRRKRKRKNRNKSRR